MNGKIKNFLFESIIKQKENTRNIILILIGMFFVFWGIANLVDKSNLIPNDYTFDSIKTETNLGIERIKEIENDETILVNFYWNDCGDCKKIENDYVKMLVNLKKRNFVTFNVEEIDKEQKNFFVENLSESLYEVDKKYYFETPTVVEVGKNKLGELIVKKRNKSSDIKDMEKILK